MLEVAAFILSVAALAISIVGFGGTLFWANRASKEKDATIRALQNRVEAQAGMQREFETLLKTMKDWFEAIRPSRMLEEIKASDEAWKRQMDRVKTEGEERLAAEVKAAEAKGFEGVKSVASGLVGMSVEDTTAFFHVIHSVMPYVPAAEREPILIESKLRPVYMSSLKELASTTPYISNYGGLADLLAGTYVFGQGAPLSQILGTIPSEDVDGREP